MLGLFAASTIVASMFFNGRHFTLANFKLKSPVTVTVALPPESDSDTSSLPQKLCTTFKFNTQNNIRIPISCPQKHLEMYLFFLKFAPFYLKLPNYAQSQRQGFLNEIRVYTLMLLNRLNSFLTCFPHFGSGEQKGQVLLYYEIFLYTLHSNSGKCLHHNFHMYHFFISIER